jgi:hypothetical protein
VSEIGSSFVGSTQPRALGTTTTTMQKCLGERERESEKDVVNDDGGSEVGWV